MNVLEALKNRVTVRAFRPDPIDRDTMLKIIEPALKAPSVQNSQPWEIFVATGEPLERMRKVYMARFDQDHPRDQEVPPPPSWPDYLQARIGATMGARLDFLGIKRDDTAARKSVNANNYRFFGAPVVMFVCMDKVLTQWSLFDLGSVTQSIMLAAQEYGVDSGEALNFVAYPDVIRAELGIPDNLSIAIGIALGYADKGDLRSRVIAPRRPVTEVVRLKGF